MNRILTAHQLREIDQQTIEAGIPGLILMENAGNRVVEILERHYAPLRQHRITVFCGKGNNGGDGFVVARQLLTRHQPRDLRVLLTVNPGELRGDAAENYRMFAAAGGRLAIDPGRPTLVIDAVLGTGISGPAHDAAFHAIHRINSLDAPVVAIDMPSGVPSDTASLEGYPHVRAAHTVTFTAYKISQVTGPACHAMGTLHLAGVGTPEHLLSGFDFRLVEPALFRDILTPRAPDSNKGTFGHALVIAGSKGKGGAAAMAGIAALRAGAGLVTVSSPDAVLPQIAAQAPELMTEPLETIDFNAGRYNVIGIGPGLGMSLGIGQLVRSLFQSKDLPMVVDADALAAIATGRWIIPKALRVLTPHPGEMSRLTGIPVAAIQADRIGVARKFLSERSCVLVLKGERTVLAFPSGAIWINPTGSPALATGGTGDILMGLLTGLLAQFPELPEQAIAAAIYLHGLAGEIGARELGEKSFLATDILRYLPAAIHACQNQL